MRICFAILLLALTVPGAASGQRDVRAPAGAGAQDNDGIPGLLRQVEQIVQAGNVSGYVALLDHSADRRRMDDFSLSELPAGATRVVIQERDREQLRGTLPGNGYRLMVDVFTEFGARARVASWRLDVKRIAEPGSSQEWAIADQERLSSVENLYRLSLNSKKQFTARDLKISAEDLDLTLAEGSVFVGDVDTGVTSLILIGRGSVRFHPEPDTEKGQVKIFCGSETLESTFDAAFVRIHPSDFNDLIAASQIQARPAGQIDARELRRAQEIFRDESGKSFVIDLGDLSRDPWSLLPGPGDFLAEIRTRRFDTLTYAHSGSEAEDITLFDRKRHRNISIYPSKRRLAAHGRFSSEDELSDYDVLDYDIDVSATPDRQWIEGRARIQLKVRAYILSTISLKLADALTVQSIVSAELGRLFGIRVKNQNTLVINLPTALARNSDLAITITFAGRLEPQAPDRETLAFDQGRAQDELPLISPEASFLYSSRSFWYPQATVSDYATARLRISIPAAFGCVASGDLEPGFPVLVPAKDPAANRKLYAFVSSQPLRYLAFIVSRFTRAETVTIGFPEAKPTGTVTAPMAGISYRSMNLSVEANPRQVARGRDIVERAADIAMFYQSILGDSPYSSFTVALVENDLPGGHSPAYFAALNQPLPTSQLVWRNDPAAFTNFPEFFIAHEVAHQWWGQAVGWRNYHEQWLSEGFAQYFAALYAQRQRCEDTFAGMMRQMRKWGIEQSDQGPVFLGYRLGHIRNESRVFRALVYNKSATVLHMLRRLVGDDAFFGGLRLFYRTMRFRKASTEDFRAAMETASGQQLERFFERWIYGSTIPKLKLAYRVEGGDVVLRVDQIGETLFDLPLTVSLQYADKKATDVLVRVTDRVAETRVPLAGTLRGVEVSRNDVTLADVIR